MFGNFDASILLPILPEILVLVLAFVILALDLVWNDEGRRNLGWVTAAGLVLVMVISAMAARPGSESTLYWGGMIRHDWLGFIFKMLFLFGAAVTALFAIDLPKLGNRGEFYLLLLASTIGMNFMATAADLVMLYLAIETTSIPLYVLAGFLKSDNKSTEAGFKYLLFGALTSTIMLYGFSLLYGFTGETSLDALARTVAGGEVSLPLMTGVLMLILVGFGFKISVVPFHFWAPDVYEGAPTPIAGFLSTASKAAGFAVLMRVLLGAFPASTSEWVTIVAVLSTASMTLGNALALAQKNIKRLLAFSSIAHAGYALIGLAAVSTLGVTSLIFYLIAYVFTNLAAFGVVAAVSRVIGSDEISDYAALSRRAPYLALAMLVAFLSLAGMPPLGGFVAKVFVFAAAVQNPGLIWLAVVGVLNSIVGLYYYLIVLKVVYLYRSEEEDNPVLVSRPYALGLTVLVFGIILLGTVFAPWFNWATIAAGTLF